MTTADYWNTRYAETKSSGNGSRGEEAMAKVAAITNVLRMFSIKSVLDLGSGDGYVAARLPLDGIEYVGYDSSREAVNVARARCRRPFTSVLPSTPFELVLSCDVLFHLTDDADYAAYMDTMFRLATRYVFVWSSDNDFVGRPHVRDRKWTPDIPATWQILDCHPLPFDQKFVWLLAPKTS